MSWISWIFCVNRPISKSVVLLNFHIGWGYRPDNRRHKIDDKKPSDDAQSWPGWERRLRRRLRRTSDDRGRRSKTPRKRRRTRRWRGADWVQDFWFSDPVGNQPSTSIRRRSSSCLTFCQISSPQLHLENKVDRTDSTVHRIIPRIFPEKSRFRIFGPLNRKFYKIWKLR